MIRIGRERFAYLGSIVAVGLTLVAVAEPPSERPAPDGAKSGAETKKGDSKADESQKPQPSKDAAKPRRDDANVRTPSQPSADDILKKFQEERPANRPVLPSGEPGETSVRTHEPAAASSARPRLPDGYILDNRVGRLSKDGAWWVFSFELENPGVAPEPPMKLLPNQLLERMVREHEGSSGLLTFIVSGEVTDFRGENYLLLRKLLRRRDMGNLMK